MYLTTMSLVDRNLFEAVMDQLMKTFVQLDLYRQISDQKDSCPVLA